MNWIKRIRQYLKRVFKTSKESSFEVLCENELKTISIMDATEVQLSYVMDMMANQIIDTDKIQVLPIKNLKLGDKGPYIEVIYHFKSSDKFSAKQVPIHDILNQKEEWMGLLAIKYRKLMKFFD